MQEMLNSICHKLYGLSVLQGKYSDKGPYNGHLDTVVRNAHLTNLTFNGVVALVRSSEKAGSVWVLVVGWLVGCW
jgi:hypothetical protein